MAAGNLSRLTCVVRQTKQNQEAMRVLIDQLHQKKLASSEIADDAEMRGHSLFFCVKRC